MKRELKARIGDVAKVEKDLLGLGAKYANESTVRYVYFNQPEGKVLKLTTIDSKTYKTALELKDNKFEIVSNDLLDDTEKVNAELEGKFGIKRKLINHRRFFELGSNTITTNQIEGVGDFLIIEAERPSMDIMHSLSIDDSAIITDSFDNL